MKARCRHKSLVIEGARLEANLVTDGVALEESLVTEGITLDASLVAKESTDDYVSSLEQLDESSSLWNNTYAKKKLVDMVASDIEYADIEPSFDSDTVSEVQDSKAEKEQFMKQIAYLESTLASQDLISNQKEYKELSISYNALKAKFDVVNREKGKSPMSNFSTPKVSISPKIYTSESSKSFPKRVSQFTTYSLQKDMKFSKKPQVLEKIASQKVFKSSDSSRKSRFLMLQILVLHR
nr:outer membrane protein porin [Tanacetum cinerariifolium]